MILITLELWILRSLVLSEVEASFIRPDDQWNKANWCDCG